MCGGFPRRGADFAALYIHVFANLCEHQELNYGIGFLDVSRCFVFGDRISDDAAMAIFTKCEIHPNCFGDFCLLLSEPNAFESSWVPRFWES